MSGNLALRQEPAPLTACTVSRDVQEFDLLIEDMNAVLDEGWGDLGFDDAIPFLSEEEASTLEFLAIALDQQDEDEISKVREIIAAAKEKGLRVILIADGLKPIILHEMLREGADDFVPYPLPEGALSEAIDRIHKKAVEAEEAQIRRTARPVHGGGDGGGPEGETKIIAVHGLGGGVGGTSFATNLAWQLSDRAQKEKLKVAIIDLDLQFGSVATYLDLDRKAVVLEVLSDLADMDERGFKQAIQNYRGKLDVFSAPEDILPLDLITGDDVDSLMTLARQLFDVVIIDLPTTLTSWTDRVLSEADYYFTLVELEMRSAQNTLRLIKALHAEELPYQKIKYVLNRAPTDMAGRSRIKRMAENLDINFDWLMADCGTALVEANDQAIPLDEVNPKHAYVKEMKKLADSLWLDIAGIEAEQDAKPKGLFGFGR